MIAVSVFCVVFCYPGMPRAPLLYACIKFVHELDNFGVESQKLILDKRERESLISVFIELKLSCNNSSISEVVDDDVWSFC